MAGETLQAEVERLRSEVEAYRQREVEGLRELLAATLSEREHYKQEAYRNADLGRQIAADLQAQIDALQSQIEVKEQVARSLRNAHARRN